MLTFVRNNPIIEAHPALCSACGVPFDAQYFDVSNVLRKPSPGETATLAEITSALNTPSGSRV